jgi:hypothetical protein
MLNIAREVAVVDLLLTRSEQVPSGGRFSELDDE